MPTIVTANLILCDECGRVEGEEHAKSCTHYIGTPMYKLPLHIIITVPPEVEQYAPDIARFVEAMVYKLGVHAHKGKWENMPITRALELLRGEEKELTEAVQRGNMVEIMLEAAD